MRVLIACEFTGTVRRAFRAHGHDAWSCDLRPAEDGSPHHLHCDVLTVLDRGWDLMVAHPVCRYLALAGAKHLYLGGRKENGPNPERWDNMRLGAEFYRVLRDCKAIPKRAIENPKMLGAARRLIGGAFTQIVQPWQFGHAETKGVGLELINLPPLRSTKIVPPPYEARVWRMPPGPEREKERSRFFDGIAEAMADQWGGDTALAELAA